MKEKSIYKNVLKLNEKIENLKKQKTQKPPSSNAVKFQFPILEMVPQMLFCSCLIKGDA
jgi:hypothetical protein